MQASSFSKQNTNAPACASKQELMKVFNTTLLSTRSQMLPAHLTDQLLQLMRQPAFDAILLSIRQLAIRENTSLKHASEKIIQTFRKMDQLWNTYVFQEGLRAIKRSEDTKVRALKPSSKKHPPSQRLGITIK